MSVVLHISNFDNSALEVIRESNLNKFLGEAGGSINGIGLGVARTTTPLFQTNFEPAFTQVYFLPNAVAVSPAFLQLLPGVGVAAFKGSAAAKLISRVRMALSLSFT